MYNGAVVYLSWLRPFPTFQAHLRPIQARLRPHPSTISYQLDFHLLQTAAQFLGISVAVTLRTIFVLDMIFFVMLGKLASKHDFLPDCSVTP